MRKIYFKTNEDYFRFYNKHKEHLKIYSLDYTKTMKIHLFYDIM